MTTQTPLDPKVHAGITQLDELMIAGGVTVTAAAVGRPQVPEPLDGVVPDIFGEITEQQVPAVGKVVLIEAITTEAVRHDLHRLTEWAKAHTAMLYLGLVGKPGKGFHGMEQHVVIEECHAAGWEIIEL